MSGKAYKSPTGRPIVGTLVKMTGNHRASTFEEDGTPVADDPEGTFDDVAIAWNWGDIEAEKFDTGSLVYIDEAGEFWSWPRLTPADDTGAPMVVCHNCEWVGSADDTGQLLEGGDRLAAGDSAPIGACPNCRGACFPLDTTAP